MKKIKKEIQEEIDRMQSIINYNKMIIEKGDYVKHTPSREEWVVFSVDYWKNELIPCGYPFPTYAKISDCVLTEKRKKEFEWNE